MVFLRAVPADQVATELRATRLWLGHRGSVSA